MTAQPSIRTPEAFLAECRRRGIKLSLSGDRIEATGRRPANPEKFTAFLRAKKPELAALLSKPSPSTGGDGVSEEIQGKNQVAGSLEAPRARLRPAESPCQRIPISPYSDMPGPLTEPPADLSLFAAWAQKESRQLLADGAVPELEPALLAELRALLVDDLAGIERI